MVQDYYKGFAGEPEVRIAIVDETGQTHEAVRMWEGYFDAIMDTLKPGPSGWTGIALHYHMNTGWYNVSPWKVEDLPQLCEQWEEVDLEQLDAKRREVHDAVAQLLRTARKFAGSVQIYYE